VPGAPLSEDVHEQHDVVICMGLDHLQIGGWSIVILLASALLAGLAWHAKTTRGNIWVSLGSVSMSVVLAWLGIVAPLLSHLFLTEGPIRLAEKVFDAALSAAAFSFVLSAALRVALLVVRRYKPCLKARSRGRALPGPLRGRNAGCIPRYHWGLSGAWLPDAAAQGHLHRYRGNAYGLCSLAIAWFSSDDSVAIRLPSVPLELKSKTCSVMFSMSFWISTTCSVSAASKAVFTRVFDTFTTG